MKQKQTQKTPKRHIHKFTTRLIEFSDRQVNRAMFVMLLIATTAFVINIPSVVQYFTAQPSSAGLFAPGGMPPTGSLPPELNPNPPAPSDPDQPWVPEGEEIKLIPSHSVGAEIHNNKVVFVVFPDGVTGQGDVYVYDLIEKLYIPISVNDYTKNSVDIYDNYVIWAENRTQHVNDVYLYNLNTGDETQVSHNLYIPNVVQEINSDLAIYGNKIVWRKRVHLTQTPSENYQEIMLYNIDTGYTNTINTILWSSDIDIDSGLAIEGDKIVWSDHSSGINNLYMYDLSNGLKTQLTESLIDSQIHPDIYGSYVVWEDWNSPIPGDAAVRIMDIITGQEYALVEHFAYSPAIYRDIVVWQQYNQQEYTGDIWMHRISDPVGANYKITNNNREQRWPKVFANKIIWEDDRDGAPWPAPFAWSIYMFELMN